MGGPLKPSNSSVPNSPHLSIIGGAVAVLVIITLAGGVVAHSVTTSRKLGKAIGKIEELKARNEWLGQAMASRSSASPDLDDLVLQVQDEDSRPAA